MKSTVPHSVGHREAFEPHTARESEPRTLALGGILPPAVPQIVNDVSTWSGAAESHLTTGVRPVLGARPSHGVDAPFVRLSGITMPLPQT